MCKGLNIDSHEVMEIFARTPAEPLALLLETRFRFWRLVFAQGSTRANYKARQLDVEVPYYLRFSRATDCKLRVRWTWLCLPAKRIGVLGFSFKTGTDDLRESPMVSLIETLIGKGFQLAIYDRHVSLARLFGANKEYIEREIPHISQLMCVDIDAVLENADVIIVGNKAEEFREIESKLTSDQQVIDLVRLFDRTSDESYQGICW